MKKIDLVTESSTVRKYVSHVLSRDKTVKTKSAEEIIIKRSLGVIRALKDEMQLEMKIILVLSEKNKADKFTRVKKSWLSVVDELMTVM